MQLPKFLEKTAIKSKHVMPNSTIARSKAAPWLLEIECCLQFGVKKGGGSCLTIGSRFLMTLSQ